MALMQFGEVFGFPTADLSDTASKSRTAKQCPFRKSRCTKVSRTDPIGVCSLTDGLNLAATCVATDSLFFEQSPKMKLVGSSANSEVRWLVYPFGKTNHGFTMGQPAVHYTLWEDVQTALREGVAPDPEEVLHELGQKKLQRNLTVFEC